MKDNVDKIIELKKMLDEKVITQEEFNKMKNDLLEKEIQPIDRPKKIQKINLSTLIILAIIISIIIIIIIGRIISMQMKRGSDTYEQSSERNIIHSNTIVESKTDTTTNSKYLPVENGITITVISKPNANTYRGFYNMCSNYGEVLEYNWDDNNMALINLRVNEEYLDEICEELEATGQIDQIIK